jgi:hypothetical protein
MALKLISTLTSQHIINYIRPDSTYRARCAVLQIQLFFYN